ncbi:glycoside hydrolase family 3 protein [Aurantiacibacter spongiae]|uniref:Glycoside hydrolase family 3 protein n=1 Tax=Aurantiacibacter spongiae TaxID=2488860 RepID=A0A3N5D8R9_9SPHN|nr:glycoside hydrolase family 3 protein [Aurantiacibacter spongiae]RPF71038.1 glycoside hydrolase family 3 protein [Aurantiacibacter spongiae]
MAMMLGVGTGLTGCATVPAETGHVDQAAASGDRFDTAVTDLLSRMSIESKVAQIIMPDISTITPADMERYRFGMYLNGGNSGPGGDDLAPARDYLELADAMWAASTRARTDGEPVIPTLWATDAVHGHANVPGATVFPHNIGLGAANDPELMRRIGAATAAEITVTGIDWTFAPTLAVVTDTRWGRTYESFSSDPAIVGSLGAAMITGLQGETGSAEFLDQSHVIATAKHWFGDGGTGGLDQGDTTGDLSDLIALHAAPYAPAFDAGVASVMASFSSINGKKMHGNGRLLDGLLRDSMGFDGVTVGDWNGHGQVEGCTDSDCAAALMAGLDVFMVPEQWRALYDTTIAQVRDGTIPMWRLNEAAGRMLRLKMAYGAFDKPAPSQRELGGKFDRLGSGAHRAVAREAVRKSLVLLENNGVLPIGSGVRVLVAGEAADNVVQQSGGWTVTWQGGGDLTEANLPGATSIYDGIAEAMARGGGEATLSASGDYARRPDVAIVVFGEDPYAEFEGDRPDNLMEGTDGLALLTRYREAGIPTVAVLLSGRPLWMNREIAMADAFVAAWLPGSEGAGVADVLIGDAEGRARTDFSGRLPFAWPADCTAGASSLLGRGAGLSYADSPMQLDVATDCAELSRGSGNTLAIFERGLVRGVNATALAGGVRTDLPGLRGESADGALSATGVDLNAQEDARGITFTVPASITFDFADVGRVPPDAVLDLTYLVSDRPTGNVTLRAEGRTVDLTSTLVRGQGKGVRTARVPLSCLGEGDIDAITLSADGPAQLVIAGMTLVSHTGETECTGPF